MTDAKKEESNQAFCNGCQYYNYEKIYSRHSFRESCNMRFWKQDDEHHFPHTTRDFMALNIEAWKDFCEKEIFKGKLKKTHLEHCTHNRHPYWLETISEKELK